MRKFTSACAALWLAFGLHISAQAAMSAPPEHDTTAAGVTSARLAGRAPVHWVSVAQIENSLLGRPPMAVGFDIDDTVLFSSPGFWRGRKEISPGSRDFLKDEQFWEKMNNNWDAFSIPKEVARALISMHVKRGDQIYFITGRRATRTENLSRLLQEDFLIPATSMHPVVFAGTENEQQVKTDWLKQESIRIFYGDADLDIMAAREVGIRGIRVLRASNSTDRPLPGAGALGEEVIVNSEF
ncbi:acid phosphatase AphA [Shimwellia blattae]|uniref:Class B acid phosphatase n=1 Tax=Shimwellia blattae (strain ATCC 29907 / DSM 4481 / JCM 1650 / NBRC 105725 / CDC 9005-74) TaxID=630626 RepID=I2BDV7_SHIBC|nr:acid phosphatase AphA [Shimwellia blattae]AFJ48711.1 class B acid phosphatase precursor [Shimwellia blattae DSM 4481 = NBRC 105725]GAB83043.1 class B acid phosphatase [Shimwellia blattae DSM 4481 = NBRC 105725]VDY66198.1 Class B acid phosphatase precursor [Shimwellia blattae]VEC27299.1 Class B acid phosphatase precursor [Shimwellia blattae]